MNCKGTQIMQQTHKVNPMTTTQDNSDNDSENDGDDDNYDATMAHTTINDFDDQTRHDDESDGDVDDQA